MANNLFISYDLHQPGRDYAAIHAAIKEVGNWAKVEESFWYVSSSLTASEALARVKPALDQNDTLTVVDASNNQAAWIHVSPTVSNFIQQYW